MDSIGPEPTIFIHKSRMLSSLRSKTPLPRHRLHCCPASKAMPRIPSSDNQLTKNSIVNGKFLMFPDKVTFPYTGRCLPSVRVAVVSQGSSCSLTALESLSNTALKKRLCVQPVSTKKNNLQYLFDRARINRPFLLRCTTSELPQGRTLQPKTAFLL